MSSHSNKQTAHIASIITCTELVLFPGSFEHWCIRWLCANNEAQNVCTHWTCTNHGNSSVTFMSSFTWGINRPGSQKASSGHTMVSQENYRKFVWAWLDSPWGCGTTVLSNNRGARGASIEYGERVPGALIVTLQVEVAEGYLQWNMGAKTKNILTQ